MEEKIISNSEQIKELLETLVNKQTEITLFFKWRNNLNSAFNLVAKISNLSSDKNYISFYIRDIHDLLMQDFEIQYDSTIQAVFISELDRYNFNLQVTKIKKGEKEGYTIITDYPQEGTYRQIRRAVRLLNNLPEEINSSECYVYDVSLTGIGLLIPNQLNFSLQDEMAIELKVPTIFNDNSEYKDLEGIINIVRFSKYNENFQLVGAEFCQLSEINKALVYRYILQRKNEFLTHNHVMPAIDVLSIEPANCNNSVNNQ